MSTWQLNGTYKNQYVPLPVWGGRLNMEPRLRKIVREKWGTKKHKHQMGIHTVAVKKKRRTNDPTSSTEKQQSDQSNQEKEKEDNNQEKD
eukprot:13221013-Ditylum_brightwellii.AAC.1